MKRTTTQRPMRTQQRSSWRRGGDGGAPVRSGVPAALEPRVLRWPGCCSLHACLRMRARSAAAAVPTQCMNPLLRPSIKAGRDDEEAGPSKRGRRGAAAVKLELAGGCCVWCVCLCLHAAFILRCTPMHVAAQRWLPARLMRHTAGDEAGPSRRGGAAAAAAAAAEGRGGAAAADGPPRATAGELRAVDEKVGAG